MTMNHRDGRDAARGPGWVGPAVWPGSPRAGKPARWPAKIADEEVDGDDVFDDEEDEDFEDFDEDLDEDFDDYEDEDFDDEDDDLQVDLDEDE